EELEERPEAVMAHVGEGAAAELVPAAEIGVGVVGVVRAVPRRAEPQVPIEAGGHGRRALGPGGDWGHIRRIGPVWISRSVPMAPFWTMSRACFWATPSLAGRKWVAILFARAASMTALASSRRFARGLCTITFRPFLRAASATVAWVWSGVITLTAV